ECVRQPGRGLHEARRLEAGDGGVQEVTCPRPEERQRAGAAQADRSPQAPEAQALTPRRRAARGWLVPAAARRGRYFCQAELTLAKKCRPLWTRRSGWARKSLSSPYPANITVCQLSL